MRSHPLLPSRGFERFYISVASLFIILYMSARQGLFYNSIIAGAMFFACAIVLSVIWWHYRVATRAKQQSLNSSLAYTELSKNSFFLYLRSFDMARRIPVRNSSRSWTKHSIVGSFWDIEHSLAIAVYPLGLLVAIGDKKSSLGAAKLLSTEQDWRAKFFELAQKSRNIFVVPYHSPSSIWEIEQISLNRKLADKTFYLMPPYYWRGTKYINFLFPPFWLFLFPINVLLRRLAERRWEFTKKILLAKGLELPTYDRSGRVFQLSRDGKVSFLAPFNDLQNDYFQLLLTNSPDIKTFRFVRPWFDRFPISWTLLVPGAVTLITAALCGVVFMRILLYQPFCEPSGSNEPTLLVGDCFFVSKFSYGYSGLPFGVHAPGRYFGAEPSRGDIAVFKLPRDNLTDYTKRVIGLPGAEIKMIDGIVYINGIPVPKERKGVFLLREEENIERLVPLYEETLPNGVRYSVLDLDNEGPLDNVGPFKVPAGHYFMMGDNRDNSQDSRVLFYVGYVPYENFVGRAEIVYFSARVDEQDAFHWTAPSTWPFYIRWVRIFKSIE